MDLWAGKRAAWCIIGTVSVSLLQHSQLLRQVRLKFGVSEETRDPLSLLRFDVNEKAAFPWLMSVTVHKSLFAVQSCAARSDL